MNEKKTVSITIDGKKVDAPVDQPILATALDEGIDIPYFCYHKDLRPDGNCRMCLVDIEKTRRPTISCMTYPTEGMIVHTKTDKVKAMQKAVLEMVLVNHPLDCPICDKVGECRLQANYFQYSGEPSHFLNPHAKVRAPKLEKFSDRIIFDSERCIKCSLCVRFSTDVSQSHGLGLVNRGVHSTVAPSGGEYVDQYSDCVIDICPVGALTSTTFRFQARVYTLQKTESVCTFCARGCNTNIEHKLNKIYRITPRRNEDVNKSWMCNAGRDFAPYWNRERLHTARSKNKEISYEQSLIECKDIVRDYAMKKPVGKALAIASTFGSNEEIASFVSLFRMISGVDIYFKTDSILYQKEYPHDDVLIRDDKNPNRYTLEKIHQLKEITDTHDGAFDLLVVWGEGLKNSLKEKQEEFLKKAKRKILFTPFIDETMSMYDLVIPTLTFIEKNGTYTNFEGKTSRFNRALSLYHHIQDEAMIFEDFKNTVKNLA